MRRIPPEQLRELLLGEGLVSAEDFDAALQDSERMKQDLAKMLVSRGLISWDYYYNVLAGYFGVERANLTGKVIDEQALRSLPEELAREKRVILFQRTEAGAYVAAMEDPSDLQAFDFLKKYFQAEVVPTLATDEDLNKGFRLYGLRSSEDFKKVIEENIRVSVQSKAQGLQAAATELPIVAIVDNIISFAISSRASDIHIEP